VSARVIETFIWTAVLIQVTSTLRNVFGQCNWSGQHNERVSRAHIHFAIARLKAQNGAAGIYIIDLPDSAHRSAWLSGLWEIQNATALYTLHVRTATSRCVSASRKATLFSTLESKLLGHEPRITPHFNDPHQIFCDHIAAIPLYYKILFFFSGVRKN